MSDSARSARPSLLHPALLLGLAALAAMGCGGTPEAEVGGGGPDPVQQALDAGHTARAIVLLDEMPALAAARVAGADEPAAAEAATAVLQDTKASLLSESDPAEVQVLNEYRHLPAMHVELRSPDALARLRARPEVVRVLPDEAHVAFLTESLPLIHQPAGYAAGATGAGTAVAVLDTGVDYTRAAFGSCASPGASGCKVVYAQDFATNDGQLDANGHGTNVAGIVLGVAPLTKIIALDVFNGQYAYTSDILSAIDWVVQNRATYNIVAMNMSLGSGGYTSQCGSDAFAGAIHTAKVAGVLSAIASGNNGYTNMISSPACVPDAVSVGAVWDASYGAQSFSVCSDSTTAADKVTCFSNTASFLTVLAPGAYITAAGITMAGTSQATPHVAGAIAALKSLYTSDTPDQVVARLRSGPRVTDPRTGLQFPRLDLGGLQPPSCVTSVAPSAAALSGGGDTATVSLSAPGGCAWTASASAGWLTVSPASGTGPTTLTLTAAPNASATRTATVTAGGYTLSFSQAKDATLPTGAVTIAGAPYVRSLKVEALVSASDPVGVTQMCVSNTTKCTAWKTYYNDFYWSLASGSAGTRYLFVWLKDAAGNVNGPAYTAVIYDATGPTGGSFTAVKGATQAALSWGNFVDAASGVASYVLRFQAGSAPSSCSAGTVLYSGTGTSYLTPTLTRKVTYGFRLCPVDRAGNVGSGKTLTVRLP